MSPKPQAKAIVSDFKFICLLILISIASPTTGFCKAVTAQSLSYEHVSEAVAEVSAAGGGTVYLPEGISPEFWTETLHLHGGINLVGKGPDKTTIRWDYDNKTGIGVNQGSKRIFSAFRISGINLIGTYDPDDSFDNTGNSIFSLISMRSTPGFRIDHCIFEGGKYVIGVGNQPGEKPSTGVIDHCKIFRGDVSYYAPVYGVSVGPREYIENKALGTNDAVVIEDCILEDLGHPAGSFGGSHYVLRNSEIRYRKNKASFPIDAHGPGYEVFDGEKRGTRAWEIYNNTIVDNPDRIPLGWRAMGLRAGKGVIFNNHISNFRYAVSFYCDPFTCNNNGLDAVEDVYIWNNTLANVSNGEVLVQEDQCTQTYVKEGSAFFLEPAPNYKPLVYPHPLVTADTSAVKKHLFILSGQSNMEGLDPDISFKPTLATAFGDNNIVVVKDAKGGQAIRRWYKKWKPAQGDGPEATGDLYDRLMEKVTAAIVGKTFATVTFVWMQGEQDAREGHGEVYTASLRGLINQLSEDLGRNDINFVIGRLGVYGINRASFPHWNMVRAAQVEVATTDSRSAWVNTDDLGDGLHYTTAGYKTLGERFAEKSIELINKHTAKKPQAPQNLSID